MQAGLGHPRGQMCQGHTNCSTHGNQAVDSSEQKTEEFQAPNSTAIESESPELSDQPVAKKSPSCDSCCRDRCSKDEPAAQPKAKSHEIASKILSASCWSVLALLIALYFRSTIRQSPHSHYPLIAYVKTDKTNLWVHLNNGSQTGMFEMFKVNSGEMNYSVFELQKADLVFKNNVKIEFSHLPKPSSAKIPVNGMTTGHHGVRKFIEEGVSIGDDHHRGCNHGHKHGHKH